MNESSAAEQESSMAKRRFGCGQVLVIVLITAVVSAGAMFWWAKHYLYASQLQPVALSAPEQEVLKEKLQRLEEAATGENFPQAPAEGEVSEPGSHEEPGAEPYSEEDSRRVISLTERELNALIAKNDPEAARYFAVDLSRDLVSLKIIVPIEEDAPFLGGKTIRIKAGLEVRYEEGQARVVLRGVSLGGIPLPSAWLGDLKGKELIQEFGEDGGFWKQFSDGIDHLEVGEGRLTMQLKE